MRADDLVEPISTLALVVIVIAAIVGVLVWGTGYKMGYKVGQTDAINGTVVYELIEQPNGETNWEHVGGGK